MRLTGITAMFGKVMAIGLVAGAVALFTPVKAEAQQFAVGVQFGSPYYQGYYAGDARRDFWRHEQWERERAREAAIAQREAWERHEAFERHERWEHARDFDRDRGYDRDRSYDRDRGYYGR